MIARRREREPDAEKEGKEGSRRVAAVLEVMVVSAFHEVIGDDSI